MDHIAAEADGLEGAEAEKVLDSTHAICPPAVQLTRNLDASFSFFDVGNERTCKLRVNVVERHTLQNYQDGAYRKINGTLRRGKTLRGDTGTLISAMDAVFARAPRLEETSILFRGGSFKGAQKLKRGKKFTDKGFVSTTTQESVARNFMDDDLDKPGGNAVLFRIQAGRGTRGIWMGQATGYGREAEFVFPRNTRFRVQRVVPHYYRLWDDKLEYTEVHLRVLRPWDPDY
mgnify:CR=1 FL=1